MEVIDTAIPGVKLIRVDVFGDARGWFCERYNAARWKSAGITADFVQDNESCSSKGVVRGLHWQAGEFAQAKLVRVVAGAVIDVAVDIRRGFPTFGKHVMQRLAAEDAFQLFIPRGFAHGFIALEDNTVLSYKCDNFHCKDAERGLRFDDPALGIEWPDTGCELLLSAKDRANPPLSEIEAWSPEP